MLDLRSLYDLDIMKGHNSIFFENMLISYLSKAIYPIS